MRLFKIILVFFAIYFIRRLIQMYRVMKHIQEEQLHTGQEPQRPTSKEQTVINAEFKVMD